MKKDVVETLSAKHQEITKTWEDNAKKHEEICKNIKTLEENRDKIQEINLVIKGIIEGIQYSMIQCTESAEEKKEDSPKVEAKKGK